MAGPYILNPDESECPEGYAAYEDREQDLEDRYEHGLLHSYLPDQCGYRGSAWNVEHSDESEHEHLDRSHRQCEVRRPYIACQHDQRELLPQYPEDQKNARYSR